MKKEEWNSLVEGDHIRIIKSGIVRKILKFSESKCATVKALKKTKFDHETTILAPNDRHLYDKYSK